MTRRRYLVSDSKIESRAPRSINDRRARLSPYSTCAISVLG
ncbi:hypothetical protein [Nocardia brasiliensis]|nr:hypothetical protein [Nocardia brasiliensis]